MSLRTLNALSALCIAAGCNSSPEENGAPVEAESAALEATDGESAAEMPDVSLSGGCTPQLPDGAQADAIDMTLHLINGVNQSEISGVTATLCGATDLACEAPLAAFGTSDASGKIAITVDSTVDLVLSLTSEAILPTLVQLPREGYLGADGTTLEVPLIAQSSTTLLGIATGQSYDGQKSIYVGDIKRCGDATPSGLEVTFLAEGEANRETFYFQNGLPRASATETDASGRWLVMNAPPSGGTVSVGEPPGDLTATIVGQPGWVTLLSLDERIHVP